MGREQGDELGDEIAYTHPDFDEVRVAYTPTDVVNLEARGWSRKNTKTGGRSTGPAAKTAGSEPSA